MYNKSYLNNLSQIVEKNIEDIFNQFHITVTKNYNYYVGICPIHHYSDNPTAFNFRLSGNGYKYASWSCWTHGCEKDWCNTPLGFIRGLLAFHKKDSSFKDAIQWVENRYKVQDKLVAAPIIDESPKFEIPEPKIQLTKEEIRGKLNIPGKYFINRGFEAKLLDFHDVGPMKVPEKGLYYREIVPVYDVEGRYCIGATCRSIFPECSKCGSYHDTKRECPKKELLHVYCKWKNWQFRKAFSLYNYWLAKPILKRTKKVILTEGCGDVWAIKQIGIEGVVCPYGRSLSIGQAKLLQNIGVTDLYVAFDADQAGEEGFKQLGKRYWQDFYIRKINIPSEFKDIGEIPSHLLYEIIRKEFECK